ncbi:MAG: hypothetical protein F4X15_02010 [Gemmatimonadetes bacterium]|nr:hypothetical protein [Gemmatimonadota bacterium]
MDRVDLTHLIRPGARRTRRRPAGGTSRSTVADYEQRVRGDASLSDLDLDLAKSFLKDTPSGGKPVLDALRDYGLVKGDAPDWGITNAALLLFAGTSARHWNPGAGIRVIRAAGTARLVGHRQSVTWMAYAGPPLASAIDEGIRLARDQISTSEHLRRIFFRDVPEYPESAWREVVLNAIAHRDYDGIAEIEIVFYDDRVEVTSPGLPLDPFSKTDVNEGRVVYNTRNPLLNRVLKDKKLVSCKASGLVRVFKDMEDSLLVEPEFANNSGRFTVTLYNGPQFATSGPGWSWIVGRLPIDVDQKRMLLACPDGFSEDDYLRLNSVSGGEARRQIQGLVDGDIITPVTNRGESHCTYFLTPDLDANRWFLEDRIPKLREHFRKHMRLGNVDYRETFGVSYPTAKRELDALVDQGFLRAGGRGRALHYLPTMALRKSDP